MHNNVHSNKLERIKSWASFFPTRAIGAIEYVFENNRRLKN